MYRKIFISHASEDKDDAEFIYNFLKSNHYEPWLDFKALKVGMQWDYEIEQALRESDFIIILLSKIATNKRGYIQREIKRMDRYAEEKLSDDIYILPILIDDCEIPRSLSKYQYMKTSQTDFADNLVESLNFQREKYLTSVDKSDILLDDCIKKSDGYKLKINTPYDCHIDYYICRDNSFFDANYINSFIEREIYDLIDTFRNDEKKYGLNTSPQMKHAYIEIGNSIVIHSSEILSVSTGISEYSGGAYPNHYSSHKHFALNPERTLRFEDFIEYDCLTKWLTDKIDNYATEDQEFLSDYVNAVDENNIDFHWNEDSFTINFISIAPHALTAISYLEIPKSELDFKLKI